VSTGWHGKGKALELFVKMQGLVYSPFFDVHGYNDDNIASRTWLPLVSAVPNDALKVYAGAQADYEVVIHGEYAVGLGDGPLRLSEFASEPEEKLGLRFHAMAGFWCEGLYYLISDPAKK